MIVAKQPKPAQDSVLVADSVKKFEVSVAKEVGKSSAGTSSIAEAPAEYEEQLKQYEVSVRTHIQQEY